MEEGRMESLMQSWDGEFVVSRHDAPTGAWIFISVHSTRRGPAGGGTRMKVYERPADALLDGQKLAASMTRKFAVAGMPYGGAKAVICLPKDFDAAGRDDLLRRYGELVRNLGGIYFTGPDVGTSSADMDLLSDIAGALVFGKSPAKGGLSDSGAITAAGVFAGCEVVAEQLFGSLSLQGRSVVVQGAGNVGGPLVRRLLAAGAMVSASDVNTAALDALGKHDSLKILRTEEVLKTPCDIFAPCALGGVLNEQTAASLPCKGISGAANNQLASEEAGNILQQRGVLYAPDFVVNLGGAMGLVSIETKGWAVPKAEQAVMDRVRVALREVFAIAAKQGCTTNQAAEEFAYLEAVAS